MSYTKTFITVAEDCPAEVGEIPKPRGGKKTVALIEHELLSSKPYQLNQDELIFEVHLLRKDISPTQSTKEREALWSEVFSKQHPCFRASALAKRYGWGAHYDQEGKMAIYGVETQEYQQFSKATDDLKVIKAMRSKRK